jgi:hypothetical protein
MLLWELPVDLMIIVVCLVAYLILKQFLVPPPKFGVRR